MKKGDRVSVIDKTGMEGFGLEDCTLLYIDDKIACVEVNKGPSHKVQTEATNVKPYVTTSSPQS